MNIRYSYNLINCGIRRFCSRNNNSSSGNKMYTSDHQWIEFGEGVAKVGVTNFGKKQLKGKVNSVHVPRVGQNYKSNDLLYVVSSDEFMAKFNNPVSGTVTKVNEKVIEMPELVNNDCENTGWVAMIETSSTDKNNSKLLSKKEYDEIINKTK